MTSSMLRVRGVSRSFGRVDVLRNMSLNILKGEFVAVVGPSGCGKTTLLNLLSGFDAPSEGKIERLGSVRMIYQKDGLFPWRTVAQNIDMGLRHVSESTDRDKQRKELISLIGLEGFESHYPHQLSGGMRQRVEMARALAGETDLLLMDEPFSALDYLTRLRMRDELARALHERPRTVVLVTHDIEEAVQLADRVVVLSGRPAQIRCELPLSISRPRDVVHPEVVKAIRQILAELGLNRHNVDSGELPLDSVRDDYHRATAPENVESEAR